MIQRLPKVMLVSDEASIFLSLPPVLGSSLQAGRCRVSVGRRGDKQRSRVMGRVLGVCAREIACEPVFSFVFSFSEQGYDTSEHDPWIKYWMEIAGAMQM